MWSPLDRVEVGSLKFKCVMTPKVEMIEDFGPISHRF